MSPTEAIPLLIVVLLMISIGGSDVQEMSVTFQGETDVDALADVHVVAGGTTTVPGDATVDGDVYVIGGTAVIDGAVDGDVTLLNGNLSVHDGASVTGTLQTYSGSAAVSADASVGRVSQFEPPTPSSSPAQRVGGFLLQFFVLGAFGWWLVKRHPIVIENVGAAITEHALVSGVIGSLGATTLLVLFVYMAFTLILLPLAIVGLFAEFLIVLYGQAVFGYLIGTRLPIERDSVATIAGIATFLLLLEVLRLVPYLGGIAQLAVAVVGFGAVLNTYFGLQRFDPITIPGGT
ncbi:Polymer-forming protein [Halogranum amylolyticum]|uniref:Polymer-forming protein n=1 Tax=Halogranum amylolyticum TaxID=660520 RepID=A0A1H8UL94_9EURY|nr:polymer-forming cytoskeletal protein [Halogranum amylolyticum]SEP03644.1 Polymer-forming protein [Halogranum amylolyticum]